MAAKLYTIERTSPIVYQDKRGGVVNGYKVDFYIPEFDEAHAVNVDSLNPAVVKAAIDQVISNRRMLADLGSE